jgi:hypothetical protein
MALQISKRLRNPCRETKPRVTAFRYEQAPRRQDHDRHQHPPFATTSAGRTSPFVRSWIQV